MPLTRDEQELCASNKDKWLVGLIHKKTYEIVLALCIEPKISLTLTETGIATSGTFIEDDFSEKSVINPDSLEAFNALLRQNHVPRLANAPDGEQVSAHQILFSQKCGSTSQSSWGGFSLKLDSSTSRLEFSFVSGAFNSSPGKRVKGAELSTELIAEVVEQTAVLETGSKKRPQAAVSSVEGTFFCVTPPKPSLCRQPEMSSSSLSSSINWF